MLEVYADINKNDIGGWVVKVWVQNQGANLYREESLYFSSMKEAMACMNGLQIIRESLRLERWG